MPRDPRELAGAWQQYQRHTYAAPSPDLAPYVERYWSAAWSYPTPYEQKIVPYPHVHLTFQAGAVTLNGVRTGYHLRRLAGTDEVFGVQFRPGCFRPFLNAPVSTITNKTLDATPLFGPPPPLTTEAVETYLRPHLPPQDPRTEEAADVVHTIATTPTLTRVEDLAQHEKTTVRQLQRLFHDYVGATPKWVIRRYRLHEVTQRLANHDPINWSALAADLGYADQPHLTRDFKSIFGETPTAYAARY
ncbi:helix-turn-helix domain-containing protein [Crossiella sp. SN42]|uniref:helix-turn-helix domain-containing protein n=1 Tax=Crossiella sp. SN42 TaxID=2944808 RepID=UPI00207CB578|nr:helix-turn-helix domain-containing protein [Crossiella sp. SN42]MCO1578096.1 helix-turn-helix domain-containing protein [Crossiella sp. SN42]